MFYILLLIGFIFIPSSAFAWGPLTHIYFGNEIYSFASLLPAGVAGLLRKYRQDFLYGNLMADIIIGKKYLPDNKSSHNWDVAMNLLEQAKRGPEKAFVYGYLSHLAADTVAHENLTGDKLDVGHTLIELKADSMINKVYWLQSVTISRAVQKRNDRFLKGSLDSFIFSFDTSKRIYKGIVFLSFLNKKRPRGFDSEYISKLHEESLARMLDLLRNEKGSFVLDKSPL